MWSQEGLAWLEDGVFFGDERDELLNARVLQLRALQERKRVLEPMLAGLALEDERAHWLMSIPGCRWYLAMFILGEVGTIHRFHSKDAFKKYCGCCPQEKSTGGRQDPFGVVQHAHKDLKWAIHQIAQHLHTGENPVGDAYRARVNETGDHGSGMTIARREVCELVYDLLMVEEPCNWAASSVLENKVARAQAKA